MYRYFSSFIYDEIYEADPRQTHLKSLLCKQIQNSKIKLKPITMKNKFLFKTPKIKTPHSAVIVKKASYSDVVKSLKARRLSINGYDDLY